MEGRGERGGLGAVWRGGVKEEEPGGLGAVWRGGVKEEGKRQCGGEG